MKKDRKDSHKQEWLIEEVQAGRRVRRRDAHGIICMSGVPGGGGDWHCHWKAGSSPRTGR